MEADFLVAVVFFTAGFLPVLAALGVAFLPVLFLALLAAGFLALLLGVLAGATGCKGTQEEVGVVTGFT